MSIFFDVDSQNSKLKIIVKKKDYSLAVERNKIKRWVREIFRTKSLNQGFVVAIKRGFLEKGFRNNYDALNLGLENFINKRQDG